jgi:lipoic acid synthetase
MVSPKNSPPPPLNVLNLDLIPYARALEFQRMLVALRRDARVEDTLLLLRHPPVITLGRRGNADNILAPREWLAEHRIEVHRVERGGDVTFHGPGQLVGYPILDLAHHRKDVGWYMHSLEEVLIRTLGEFGICGRRLPGQIGVWLDHRRKIVSLGVRIEGWTTYHGFALNVGQDLSHFALIVPCGLAGKEMTSMEATLGEKVEMGSVRESIVRNFSSVFGMDPVEVLPEDLPHPNPAYETASYDGTQL